VRSERYCTGLGLHSSTTGLQVILEISLEKAIDHWSAEIIDLIEPDINAASADRVVLYKRFRAQSVVPLLLLYRPIMKRRF
jgi:hypothetical protein